MTTWYMQQIGLIADFSTTAWPNVPHEGLGLAQIEELHGAISALKHTRRKALESETHESAPPSDEPPLPPFRTVAVTDSFVSQSDYVLATYVLLPKDRCAVLT